MCVRSFSRLLAVLPFVGLTACRDEAPTARPEIVIRLKRAPSDQTLERLERAWGVRIRRLQGCGPADGSCRFFDCVIVARADEGIPMEKLLDRVRGEEVGSTAPNVQLRFDAVPNDPDFWRQWGLHNSGQDFGRGSGSADADIDSPEAWDLVPPGERPIVAVIDSGVDTNHPDLAPNLWENPGEIPDNGLDDDGNGLVDDRIGWDFGDGDNDPTDEVGHGTHVAGIIAAAGGDGFGISGVCPRARIMALKVAASGGAFFLDAALAALRYAAEKGARIVNASWGVEEVPILRDAILELRDGSEPVLFVASAGNSGMNLDLVPQYPASYDLDNIISVAASTPTDGVATFSNYGPNSVDVAAPGVDIYSTVPGGGHAYKSGTSMSAPMVSGLAALLWSRFPTLTYGRVRDRILTSADRIAAWDGKLFSGGRINARTALEEDAVPPRAVTDLAVAESKHDRARLTWTAVGDDDGLGQARIYEIRYSRAAIFTDADFDAATRAAANPMPTPAGEPLSVWAPGLAEGTAYYFALRAWDDGGNRSAISNGASATTTVATVIWDDTLEGDVSAYAADPGWTHTGNGVQPYPEEGSWSLTKFGPDPLQGALVTPTLSVPAGTNASLSFSLSTELDGTTSTLAVEFSVDGGVWQGLAAFAGPVSFGRNEIFVLPDFPRPATIRFRFAAILATGGWEWVELDNFQVRLENSGDNRPDLAATAVAILERATRTVTIQTAISNRGSAPTSPGTLDYFLSATPSLGPIAYPRTRFLASRPVAGGLAPGGSSVLAESLEVPMDLSPGGNYFLVAHWRPEPGFSDGGFGDNEAVAGPLALLWDFAIESVTATQGSPSNVGAQAVVGNLGFSAGEPWVEFWLSQDADFSGSADLLLSVSWVSLAVGQTAVVTGGGAVPDPSYRYVIARVAVSPTAPESDYVNNVATDLINRVPTATIVSVSPTLARPGEPVTFVGSAIDADGWIAGYEWTSSRQGTLSTADSFATGALERGGHVITFRARDDRGAWSYDAIVGVFVGEAPSVSIEPLPAQVWRGAPVTFRATASDPDGWIVSVVWTSNLETGTLSTAAEFTKADLGLGLHTITVEVTDNLGFAARDAATIEVRNRPPAAAISSIAPNPATEGESIVFSGTATDADGTIARIEWTSEPAGVGGTGFAPTVPGLSAGTYSVRMTAWDNDGAAAAADATLVVDDVPEVTLGTLPAWAYRGDPIVFSGTVQDSIGTVEEVRWTSDLQGLLSNGLSFTRSDLMKGTHAITLSARDSYGRWGAATAMLEVRNRPPTAAIVSITPETGIEGMSVSFEGSAADSDGSGGILVEWISDRHGLLSNSLSFSRSDLSPGAHTISLRVTDGDGAVATDAKPLRVLPEIHVGTTDPTRAAIKMWWAKSKTDGQWYAYANVIVVTSARTGAAGVTVTGNWSGHVAGPATGVTGTTGEATFKSPSLGARIASGTRVTFTVAGLSAPDYGYNSGRNEMNFATLAK